MRTGGERERERDRETVLKRKTDLAKTMNG